MFHPLTRVTIQTFFCNLSSHNIYHSALLSICVSPHDEELREFKTNIVLLDQWVTKHGCSAKSCTAFVSVSGVNQALHAFLASSIIDLVVEIMAMKNMLGFHVILLALKRHPTPRLSIICSHETTDKPCPLSLLHWRRCLQSYCTLGRYVIPIVLLLFPGLLQQADRCHRCALLQG